VFAGRPGQVGDLGSRIILGALEHPGSLIVDNEEGDRVYRVTARHRPADEVDHDVPAACLVRLAALER
jgi:hypothetical protein